VIVRGTWNAWERKYSAHRVVMGKPSDYVEELEVEM
jgi:hypothetical protein